MMEEENRGVRRRRGMFEEFIGDGCCRGGERWIFFRLSSLSKESGSDSDG